MATFQVGETIICSVTVTNPSGTLVNPATSMSITIRSVNVATILAATAMTLDSTGKYHYDYASTGETPGTYTITYTATDGARVTIQRDSLVLE